MGSDGVRGGGSENYIVISIHAPRMGSDFPTEIVVNMLLGFQSTLPARGATTEKYKWYTMYLISIHAPREGSDGRPGGKKCCVLKISIHAPREGSDFIFCAGERLRMDFNPRSPRGERPECALLIESTHKFQSTLPARGATYIIKTSIEIAMISIHAPREGSD